MTPKQRQAAERLVAVLDAENAMLVAADYTRIVLFSDEKRMALDALNAATGPADGAPSRDDAARELARRLAAATTENRRLLAQAIKVQNRIMGIVANAARQSLAPAGYGAGGRQVASMQARAVALVVRA